MSRRKPLCELSKRHVRRLITNDINNEQSPSTSSYSCQDSVYNDDDDCACLEIYEDVSTAIVEIDTHLSTTNHEKNDVVLSVPSENSAPSVHAVESLNSLIAAWAIDCNINLAHSTKLLKILRTHECFSKWPSDARTLLNTPRVIMEVVPMTPGHYIHFGLEKGIKMLIQFYGEDKLDNEIKLTLNIDGLPLFKSSPYSFWPILASFASCAEIFIIGVYYGESKPQSVTEYLQLFVEEYNMLSNNGLSYNTKPFKIMIKNIVCDAPAKSYILNVKGHSGYSSCTKCKIEGIYKERRVCFPEIKVNTLRTDEGFRRKEDDDFHLPGFSPLITITEMNVIKDVPYDYMHLICLGVVKKLILLWQAGSLKYRLPHQKVELMSQELIKLRKFTPVEFCRKPRSMKYVKYWKATEYRQFLLYTGFTVISKVVKQDILLNFLSLVAGIRILCTTNTDTCLIEYAEKILNYFVKTFKIIYGEHNMSHNIHGILHIVEDVIRHGSLDTYSCFKFENYMQRIKSHIRKPEKPLQQLKKRYDESCSQLLRKKTTVLKYNVFETSQHFDGPVTDGLIPDRQFRKATCNGFAINLQSAADRIFGLRGTNEIIKIMNIVEKDGKNFVVGQKFTKKEDLFSTPCDSSLIGMYFISQLHCIKTLYLLDELEEKYYSMPYTKTRVDGFIVASLLQ